MPPITVEYVEHRAQVLRCPGCKTRTRGTLGVVGESAFGPILQAALVTLTARNRVSRRDLSELAGELFGVGVSTGARLTRSANAPADCSPVRTSGLWLGYGAINVDETGWFLAGENRSIWTAATPTAAIFRIVADRHRDRLIELLGPEFEGIVTSDRWWAYDHLDPEQRQACWSHLQRDFRFHSEGLALQKEFGQAGLELTGRMFKAWHAFGKNQDRERLILEMKPIQDEFLALLQHAGQKSKRHRLHRRFANNLLKIWPARSGRS